MALGFQLGLSPLRKPLGRIGWLQYLGAPPLPLSLRATSESLGRGNSFHWGGLCSLMWLHLCMAVSPTWPPTSTSGLPQLKINNICLLHRSVSEWKELGPGFWVSKLSPREEWPTYVQRLYPPLFPCLYKPVHSRSPCHSTGTKPRSVSKAPSYCESDELWPFLYFI